MSEKMTRQEVADHLGVCLRTIDRWRAENVNLPFHEIGRRVVYRKEDVVAFENACRVETAGYPR